MPSSKVAQQLAPDPLPPEAGRDRQIEDFRFWASRSGNHESDYGSPAFGNQAFVGEIVSRIPLCGLRSAFLDLQNRRQSVFTGGPKPHPAQPTPTNQQTPTRL